MGDIDSSTSVAEPGEIADEPDESEIKDTALRDEDGIRGFMIRWKTSLSSYLVADSDSYEDLEDMN